MDKHIPIKRWQIMKKVIDGEMTLTDACDELELSYRQAIRMKQNVIANGVRGLIHGNTGRRPTNALSDAERELIVKLSRNGASSLNDSRFTEFLLRDYNIDVSRETVRKIRRVNDIAPAKSRNQAKRTVTGGRAAEGQSIFWDGMIHQWFPRVGYSCCLIAAIDDASGRCCAARFFPFEESFVYLWALQHVLKTYGVPGQIIQDCNTLLKRAEQDWSIEEQLRGRPDPTQVGKAVQELGIEQVFVKTKRQKRYFERIFEQLHISLLEDFQQHDIADIDAGNKYLDEHFIEHFNQRHALSSDMASTYWRPMCKDCDIERVCSFYYEDGIDAEGRLHIGNVTIPLAEEYRHQHCGRSKIEVRQLLDGTWRVYSKNRIIGEHPSTPLLEPVRIKVRSQRNTTRAASSSWIYPAEKM
jgi:transposase